MNIFVTGAAGLLGGALVTALAKAGHAVVGLVHSSPDIVGNDGILLRTKLFDETAPDPDIVTILHGDVSRAGLGLEPAVLYWLNRHIDVVIHCAALVKFEADYTELEAVNVEGTRHAAQLCLNARFIHVSTAYVCGLKNGLIAETPCAPDGAFGNGYERSKAQAEAVLNQMRPDAIIARPSIIVGEAETGRIRSFDTIYRAFKFIAEGKVTSVPVSPLASLNFVPIDYVVGGICDMVRQSKDAPRIIHLTARHAVSATHFLRLIGKISGLNSPDITSPEQQSAAKMGIADRLAQPYWGYFQRHPEFATDALVRHSGRQAPDMDDGALTRQIRYCLDAGFIRANKKTSPSIFSL